MSQLEDRQREDNSLILHFCSIQTFNRLARSSHIVQGLLLYSACGFECYCPPETLTGTLRIRSDQVPGHPVPSQVDTDNSPSQKVRVILFF